MLRNKFAVSLDEDFMNLSPDTTVFTEKLRVDIKMYV